MCNLKAAQINKQCSLIHKFLFYEFELGHKAAETTKNICCSKGEKAVIHSTISRLCKKFCSGCQNHSDQAKSAKPKNMDSKAILQAWVKNLASSTWRVSGKLSISQSSIVCHFHDLSKSIWSYQILSHIKILQNFWLTKVVSSCSKFLNESMSLIFSFFSDLFSWCFLSQHFGYFYVI